MPLDPEEKPREFFIIVVAAAMKVFSNKPWSDAQHLDAAEKFVDEVERRYGKLDT